MAATTPESRLRSRATRAGVGFSEKPNSRQAGIEAVTEALDRAGIDECDVVLLFATSKHSPTTLRDGVLSVVGPGARIIGGAAVGVITNDRLGYEGHQVAAAVLAAPDVHVDLFVEHGIAEDEHACGVRLGEQLRRHGVASAAGLLLLFDLVKRVTDDGSSLNMAAPLLRGMTEAIGAWPPTAGAGLTGDLYFNPPFQWTGDGVAAHTAMAVLFSGAVRMDVTTIHGCRPASAYQTVTKAEGNVVLEFGGRPAVGVIMELMGPDASTDWLQFPHFLTLGINHGDQFAEFDEEEYAVRFCMAVDRERGGLVMFGDDLVPGSTVQLMRRSIDFAYVGQRTRELLARLEGRRPLLALYVDCAGRAADYSGTDREDAEEVQKVIGPDIPLLGWYGGAEIAQTGPVMQSHNYTGVLAILSE